MSNVLVFTPKNELDFKQNYDEFVGFAKNELTLFADQEFDGEKGWDCDKWSFYTTTAGKRLTFVFGVSQGRVKYTPFAFPFSDFAKAYVRYQQSLNPKNSTNWYRCFKWLYLALAEQAELNKKTAIDIMDINNAVINRTEELIRANIPKDTGRRTPAIALETLLKFIKVKRLKLDFQDWTNPFPGVSNKHLKLDSESLKERMEKCPSDYQMMQVAEAFRRAKTPRQTYFTSLMVMLMCQPSRSVELNGLTINSLQKSDQGRWYLMWNPAKGGDPVRKWIPVYLEDVVQQAFKQLIEISAPARKAAKFAYENPDMFMIHEQCITPKNYPQNKTLKYDQFAKATGLRTGVDSKGKRVNWPHISSKPLNDLINKLNGVSDWRKELLRGRTVTSSNEILTKHKGLPTSETIQFPSYHDLRVLVDEQFKRVGFPEHCGCKIWDCITFIRDNEFHKDYNVRPFSWIPMTHGSLANALGRKVDGKGHVDTVFEELEITDEDGTPLILTSHQFRHWLNTKLKLAGVEDWLIAKWSGRADVKQNDAYDGRTQAQKSRLTKRIGHVSNAENVMTVAQVNHALTPHTSENPPLPMVLHDLGLPVSLKSLGVKREGVAQFTGLGFCVHNYAESPCVKNADCATCSEHVCLKGMPQTLTELKNLERLYEEQLGHARESSEGKVFGADRWVTSLGFKLAKVKALVKMLEDPNRKDGAVVRVSDELDPSPVKRSLNLDEQEIIPTFDLTALALSDLE